MHRPVRRASRIRLPNLLVVPEKDTMAPAGPALRMAKRALGELFRRRGGHDDVDEGGEDHVHVLKVEVNFLQPAREDRLDLKRRKGVCAGTS